MPSKRVHNRIIGLVLISVILTGMSSPLLVVNNVFAAPILTLKWSISDYIQTSVGPVADDLTGDSRPEIVATGIRRSDGMGIVAAIDGATGAIIWEYEDSNVDNHNPCDIADLNNDGFKEIVVPTREYPLVLHGNDGSLYWRNPACDAHTNYQAICDIDGDGYVEIFVNSGDSPYKGYDYITSLDYQGNILNQAWNWHPCWGGLTIGSPNFDGRYVLFQGDRSSDYNPSGDAYEGGGMGVRALDAHTLTPLWNDPTILCSSHCPVLADVDKDGILDVIVLMQTSNGIAVLNSADGSVVTTGGVYRKGRIATHSSHSPPTVYDIDGDGNLELIDCNDSPVRIYDLYDWELDATLPIECHEPPQVGDVTGDGKLDIIAATDARIYVYIYNDSSGNYEQVDYIAPLSGNLVAFTIIQDVDGDGNNEVVVTSSMGTVYCFDTPAPTPTPPPRSGLQLYGEYKRRAAVFEAPPTPTRPTLTDEQPTDNSLGQMVNPTLSIRAADFQENDMDIVFRTNASGTWQDIQSYIHVPTGVYTASPANMDAYGTTYHWSVNATDTVTGNWSHNVYRFTTYSNPPTHDAPLVVSTGGSKDDLTCYNQTTADPDGNEVTNIYNWYVNDQSLTNLLLPFDTHPQPSEEGLLTDGFEYGFDNWDENGITNWDRTTSQKHAGSWSAHAGDTDSYLTSDDVDLSAETGFTVSFWYRDDDIDDDDSVYVQFWDGSSYDNIFELGNTSPEDTWHHYSIWYRTLFSYGISDFHIRFSASGIDSGENLWIDDVVITADGVGGPVASVKDYSGYDNHGSAQGPAWTSGGVVGGAYIFDGDDRIVVEENGASLGGDGSWSEMSVEFWVKATENTGTERLLWKHAASSTDTIGYRVEFRAYSDSNYIRWRVYTPYTQTAYYYIDVGPRAWHHVVCTYESGVGQKIYVDGVECASNLGVSGNIQATVNGPIQIGYYSGSGDFSGVLDEVRIYPRALTWFQVSQRYLDTKDGLSSNSTIPWQETVPGEAWKCQVTPNDGLVDGAAKFSNTVTVSYTNLPPAAENLMITPAPPTSLDDLVASYDFVDPDGDPEFGSEIRWYKDSVLQPSLNDSPTVSSSLTARGEDWYFTVRPSDSLTFGDLATSSTATIGNAPPSFGGVHIAPDPAFDSSTLTATPYGWFDNDGDAEGYMYQWQVLAGGTWDDLVGETGSTLGASSFAAGDYVRVQVTADDGTDYGTVHTQTKWIVTFTSLTDPLLVSSLGTDTTAEDLTCYHHDFAGATSYIYSWYVDDVPFTNLHLPFDTNNPSTADYSGYSNDGAVSGATWTSSGIEGGAYSFDGWEDIITVADSASLGNDGTWSEITLEYWVYPYADQWGARILNKNGGDADDSGNYMTGFNTATSGPANVVFFGIIIGGSYVETYSDTNTVIPSGSWSHIVATYKSGDGIKLYINGVLRSANLGVTGNIDASVGEPLFIGYSSAIGGTANRYLNGRLDDVRVYSRALTPELAMQRYVDSRDGLIDSATIVAEETSVGDVWKCLVTPNTGTGDGTAKFSNPLTVVEAGATYTLTVNVVGGGSVSRNATGPYYDGDVVELTAVADPGWVFSAWSGALSGSANPTTIIMDGDKTVTATFIQEEYTLTINVVGSGSVSRNDTGPYYYGDIVELTALPDPGWSFSMWSGNLTGSVNPDTILIDGDKVVTATFLQDTYTLTINIVGSGVVDRNVTGPYYHGAVVELYANTTEYPGWSFSAWSGDLSGAVNPTTITMDGDKMVNATFIQETYTLTVHVDGSGVVNRNTTEPYYYGDVVELTAVADVGWLFSVWSGDLAGSANPEILVMDNDKVVNATFIEEVYALTVNIVGDGSVDRNNTGPYYYGDVVELTALPDPGWVFSLWGGDLSGSANPALLTMDGNKTVTATFIEETYSLTINIEDGGSVDVNATGPYSYGDVVELTAVPNVGWLFSAWSVDLSGSVNPTTIVMDADKTVNATFVEEEYTLTVNILGNGTVDVNATEPYHYGDVIELTATADVGWVFSAWNGDLSGSANPATILMDGNKVVNATFLREEYTLTINIIGGGSVDRNNTGPYYYGDVVELTAVADVGWTFSAWSVDLAGSTNPETLTIDGDKVVNATFALNEPPTIDSYYPPSDPSIYEGESQLFNVTYSDPNSDPVSVQWFLNGSLGGSDGNYTYTADYMAAGVYNVTVVVSDGLNHTSHEWTLTVLDVNRAPTIDSYAPTDLEPEVDEGSSLAFNHTSSDPDGDSLFYSWLLDDIEQATTQNWTYTPGYTDAGFHNVTLVVSDGTLTDSQEWNVTVSDINRPPIISDHYPPSNPTIIEGESQEFNITYHDPDGDLLTVQWYVNGIPTSTFDNYTFTADYESAGVYNITVVVSDGLAQTSYQWTLAVTNVERDVAVTNVNPSGDIVYDGYSLAINVTITNQGTLTETFNVTVYADTTVIGTLANITLTSGNSTTITFTWNTTGFAMGDYTISAYASTVPGETDTTNNTLTDGTVTITIPGDIDGDGDVDRYDFALFCDAYGSSVGDPNYNRLADLQGDTPGSPPDGDVDSYDFGAFSDNYGKTYS